MTGVVAFGLFVQLDQVYVEGLVHVADLTDDFYRYDETGHRLVGQRRGRVLRLGDPLTVIVKGIDEEFMEIKLAPVLPPPAADRRERGGSAAPPRERKPRAKVVRPRPSSRRRGR